MKVFIDRSGCISCGLCAETCPEVFHMADDGLAEVYAAPILHSMRDCTIADRHPPDLRAALTGAWE